MRAVAALLVAASIASAQDSTASLAPYRARLAGVFDFATGEPIEGAEIVDLTSGTKALTTKTGTVSLVYLPDGGSLVRIRKVGYTPITRFIAISPADTVPLTIMLVSATTVLPAVVTTDSAPHYLSPGLRAFEERRKTGLGQFISETELRKSDSRELPDVLRPLHGVTIACSTRTPRRCTAGSFRSGRGQGCPYLLFIDGIKMSDINLLAYNVGQFAGVEAYTAATIPPMYNMTGTACGVLLLWSRER